MVYIAIGGQQPPHLRKSLPPAWSTSTSGSGMPSVLLSANEGVGQEMEEKGATRQYRFGHVHGALADENTLQPMHRVSKAYL